MRSLTKSLQCMQLLPNLPVLCRIRTHPLHLTLCLWSCKVWIYFHKGFSHFEFSAFPPFGLHVCSLWVWYKLEYFLLFLLWRPEWSLLRMVSLNQAETWTRQRTTAHHMFPFKNEKIQWWSNTNNQINETLRSRKNIFNRTLRLSLLNKH